VVLVVRSETMHEDAFRELRKSMGLTQAQMASLLRLPVATVKTLEAGSLASVTSKKPVPTIMAKDGRRHVTGSPG
jgi:DNA-binding transcriptional regulator YiaG